MISGRRGAGERGGCDKDGERGGVGERGWRGGGGGSCRYIIYTYIYVYLYLHRRCRISRFSFAISPKNTCRVSPFLSPFLFLGEMARYRPRNAFFGWLLLEIFSRHFYVFNTGIPADIRGFLLMSRDFVSKLTINFNISGSLSKVSFC